MKTAIFFAPYADVWVHSLPELEVAESLRDSGWNVLRITCDRTFAGHCVAMSARGIGFSSTERIKAEVCRSCQRRSKLLQKNFKFTEYEIGDHLAEDDLNLIDELVSSLDSATWQHFTFRNAPLGRLAFYDFSLTHKLNSVEIPSELWMEYKNSFRNCLKTYFSLNNVFEDLEADLLVTYNGLYATNNTAAFVAREKGVRTWSLQAGQHLTERYGTIYAYQSNTLPNFAYKTDEWAAASRNAITHRVAARVTDHILKLFQASNRFVYSSPSGTKSLNEIRNQFGVVSGSKVLLATMSSADEIFAANMAGILEDNHSKPLFVDGFEWIDFLINHMRNRPDLHLIIRVHPREFPNKRESVLAPSVSKLRRLFDNIPPNVSINWPDQEVSLYDLAHIVDVVLNSSSSAGLEMSALGLPVVLNNVQHMLAYDPAIHRPVVEQSDYMSRVDEAITKGWSIDNMRMAYRWWGFLFSRVAIDISKGFTYPADGYISSSPSRYARIRNEVLKTVVKYGPLVHERIQLSRRDTISIGPLLSEAVLSDSEVLVGPPDIELDQNVSEDLILAKEAERLLQVLDSASAKGSELVTNFREFVSKELF